MNRYILSDAPQGSPEWLMARHGKATGSRADAIVSKIKTGEAAARRDYRVQLVTERLTGKPIENGCISNEMQFGLDQEPFARMSFEASTGIVVREAGFAYLPDIQAGCSVDGFIDDGDRKGILEIKVPKSATHISYLLGGRIPPAYLPQITHNMWVVGAAFVDFISFDPRMPAHLQLFRIRMERDDARIKAHEEEVMLFLSEVDDLIRKLGSIQPC